MIPGAARFWYNKYMEEDLKEKELDQIEEELLKKNREKRKEKMIIEGRSVFEIKKKKEEDSGK